MTDPVHGGGPIRDAFVRIGLRLLLGAYLRIRITGGADLPSSPYLVCFNHPSWSDPLVLCAHWPDTTRRLWIFGPRERDMSVGPRNALIRWTGRGVPFMPGGADVIDVTRRATAVLRGGGILIIAGEGRLSDREGEALPLQTGLGHFAMMAGVPIVPVAISGTRWLRFGKVIRVTIGEPIGLEGLPRGRPGAVELTGRVQTALAALLEGPHDERVPGPFGRWLSEAFNERPWLDDPAADPVARKADRASTGR